jgi:hypothetical protein
MLKSDRLIARLVATGGLFALALATASSAQASIVQNGSFESQTGPFVNNVANYMQLGAGSTEIAGWTITSSSGNIVLAQTPTGDGQSAADGTYFIDLSGLGSESPDGAVSQTISTVAGATYGFSMDLGTGNTGTIFASVGGNLLSLSSGASFTVGGTSWTQWTGSFTGDALNHAPLLTIGNGTRGSQIDFVDNISVVQTRGGTGGVPEPEAWSLMILGFGGIGATLRRRRMKVLALA